MADASYFPRDVMLQLGFPNVLIEYFRNQFDRAGGSASPTQNLVQINTTLAGNTATAESTIGLTDMALYLMAENDRLKRRIEQLEALL